VTYRISPDEVARLGAFLVARGLMGSRVTVHPIGDGHANITLHATDGDRQVIVRRPPPPPLPPGANDVLREARVIAAVGAAGAAAGTAASAAAGAADPSARDDGVPVPEILATGEAGDVFDVPFFVMSYVEGEAVTTGLPWSWGDEELRRDLSLALVEGLARLRRIDWQATGLRGRPEGANLRQVQRLGRLVADPDGLPPADFAEIDAWLQAHAPRESAAALVHGDYRLGNVLLAPDEPKIRAVLDWELASIGDPLVDLGYFLASWASPGSALPLTPIQELGGASANPGFATTDELAAHYAAETGAALDDLPWFVALANWKLAVLYEYSRRRFEAGDGDPYYAGSSKVEAFLAEARRIAGLP
jgi:aminoglycoside phosphotransferase (APT) family kinase protein